MRNVRFRLSYDGSRFFGWQRQDGFLSVQEALEDAVLASTGQTTVVHGAGRTDTGVHALGMVAHMHVDTHLDDDRLRHAINAHVTEGISIARLETCRDDFHARFDAVSKRYLYVIATTRFEPVFGRTQQHWTNHPLDLPRMRAAAALMRGTHDFKAFGNTGSPRKTTVRTLHALHFLVHRQRIAFVVQADGFLYNSPLSTTRACSAASIRPGSDARGSFQGSRTRAEREKRPSSHRKEAITWGGNPLRTRWHPRGGSHAAFDPWRTP